MIFIIDQYGIPLEYYPNQKLKFKRGQDVILTLKFYKDRLLANTWDLSSATKNFFAKTDKNDLLYKIEKADGDSGWDVSQASSGILLLTISDSDLDFSGSVMCEMDFTISGVTYKTLDFPMEIIEDIKT